MGAVRVGIWLAAALLLIPLWGDVLLPLDTAFAHALYAAWITFFVFCMALAGTMYVNGMAQDAGNLARLEKYEHQQVQMLQTRR
jgi:hypothetical protein